MSNVSTPPKPRRWPWLLTGALLLCMLAPAFMAGYVHISTRLAWDAAVRETDAKDPRWRFDEIIADTKPTAEEIDRGEQFIRLSAKFHDFEVKRGPNGEDLFLMPPGPRLNEQQERHLTEPLDQFAASLAESRQLKDLPAGGMALQIPDIYFQMEVPELWKLRGLAEVLAADARLLAHQGKVDPAAGHAMTILRLGQTADRVPTLTTLRTRMGMWGRSARILEHVLGQGELSLAMLEKLQARYDEEASSNHWLRGIRTDRAGFHRYFEKTRSGAISLDTLAKMAERGQPNFAERVEQQFPALLLRHYPYLLRYMNRCVEAASLSVHEQHQEMMRLKGDPQLKDNPLLFEFIFAVDRLHRRHTIDRALLHCTIAALACERYRQSAKRWPDALDDVVKAGLLREAPRDPTVDGPVSLHRTPTGVEIKSKAEEVNEAMQGKEVPTAERMIAVRFRLFDPSQRRGEPLPIVEAKDVIPPP